MNLGLDNKVSLVTGAAGGLGQAIARTLAAEGSRVVVHYRRSEATAKALCEEIQAAGGHAWALQFDVRDAASVRAGVDEVVEREGALDVVVNNAAVVADGPVTFMSDRDWSDVVDTDLTGVFHVCRAAVRIMMATGGGSIVNVTSAAAHRASPGQANYVAAKAGLEGFSSTLAREVAHRGVRINCVAPGLCEVGMAERSNRTWVERLLTLVPLHRAAAGQEIADAVAFLASDRASYVVGATLVVDGGMTL